MNVSLQTLLNGLNELMNITNREQWYDIVQVSDFLGTLAPTVFLAMP